MTVYQPYVQEGQWLKREILYNILSEFGVPMELVRPVKMCLNKMFRRICIYKYLFDTLHIQNDLKWDASLL
jgi:hypothetical protein